MAYQSNESGRHEVYVHSFPDVNKGKWQISTGGGNSPLWSPDGRELYYRRGDSIMAAGVETEPAFKPGKSMVLFKGKYQYGSTRLEFTPWDISPDGKRFLMIKPAALTEAAPAEAGPRKINMVLNWTEELKQRVPVK